MKKILLLGSGELGKEFVIAAKRQQELEPLRIRPSVHQTRAPFLIIVTFSFVYKILFNFTYLMQNDLTSICHSYQRG